MTRVLPNHNSFLQFRTETFIRSFFDSRSDDVFSSCRENCRLFWTLLFRAGRSCIGVFSFSKEFHLFAVRLLFRSIILFLPTRGLGSTNTSPSPFRVLRNKWISCIPGGFLVSLGSLPFVPRISSRSSPSPLSCFAPRFFYLRLTFFCSTQWFQVLPVSFVKRSDFHCIHAHIPLFPEIYFFGFSFCLVRHFFHFAAHILLS